MLNAGFAFLEVVLNIVAAVFKKLLQYALLAALLFASLITLAVLTTINVVK